MHCVGRQGRADKQRRRRMTTYANRQTARIIGSGRVGREEEEKKARDSVDRMKSKAVGFSCPLTFTPPMWLDSTMSIQVN